jgi:hypothetical protein
VSATSCKWPFRGQIGYTGNSTNSSPCYWITRVACIMICGGMVRSSVLNMTAQYDPNRPSRIAESCRAARYSVTRVARASDHSISAHHNELQSRDTERWRSVVKAIAIEVA